MEASGPIDRAPVAAASNGGPANRPGGGHGPAGGPATTIGLAGMATATRPTVGGATGRITTSTSTINNQPSTSGTSTPAGTAADRGWNNWRLRRAPGPGIRAGITAVGTIGRPRWRHGRPGPRPRSALGWLSDGSTFVYSNPYYEVPQPRPSSSPCTTMPTRSRSRRTKRTPPGGSARPRTTATTPRRSSARRRRRPNRRTPSRRTRKSKRRWMRFPPPGTHSRRMILPAHSANRCGHRRRAGRPRPSRVPGGNVYSPRANTRMRRRRSTPFWPAGRGGIGTPCNRSTAT